MKTLYGLLIIAGAVGLAVWGLPKLLSATSPSSSTTASAGAKEAVEQAKQAGQEIVDTRSGVQEGIYEGVTGEAPPESGYGAYAWDFFTSGPIGLAYGIYERWDDGEKTP